MRFVTAFMAALLPLAAMAVEWDDEYVETLYAGRQLDPIEGVWQFPADGGVIAIVKSSSTKFDIYLLDSPCLDVRPGTRVGEAVSSPKRNYYDGTLASGDLGRGSKLVDKAMTFTVNDNGTLTMRPYKTGYSVSFRRWFSYLFRITVTDNSSHRPADLDGARRIYPYRITDHLPVSL